MRDRCLMMLICALLIGYFATGAAPAQAQRRTELLTRTIEVDKLIRTYHVYVPQTASAPSPVVLVLHGGGGFGRKGLSMPALTQFGDIADENKFILVYPDSYGDNWNDGRKNLPDDTEKIDDLSFFRAMIEAVIKEFKGDPTRVYSTGISNGGFMTQRLACDLSDKLAAVASVASTMAEDLPKACVPVHPMPVTIIIGTNDPLVKITGGPVAGQRGRSLSLKDTQAFWAKFNGCQGDPSVVNVKPRVNDKTFVERTLYRDCRADVQIFAITGGGHTWPGGLQYMPELIVGKTSQNLDASQTIWDFFAQFTLAK